MDNTIKTKRSPVGESYMTFRFDCPMVYARAYFEARYNCVPAEWFVDEVNGSLKVGPIPNSDRRRRE